MTHKEFVSIWLEQQTLHTNLVALLLRLAAACHAALPISRDPLDGKVTEAFRKVVLEVHPDQGGCVSDAQKLQDARGTITLSPQTLHPRHALQKERVR